MPAEKSSPTPAAQRRMNVGKDVGQLAKQRFPGGVTVPVWELTNEQAAEHTLNLMSNGVQTIFEATFIFEQYVARVDVLEREGAGWRITEVKATSRYKRPDHLPDVAFQAAVFVSLGHALEGVALMHLNPEYVWAGGDWNVKELFAVEDVSADVGKAWPNVLPQASAFLSMEREGAYPAVDGEPPYFDPVVFAHCKECEFAAHCSKRVSNDHIYFLGLHHSKTKKLLAEGIRTIAAVPSDFAMSPSERLRFEAFSTGTPVTAPGLKMQLDDIQYPAHLIDFETVRPDLPLFTGHSPFTLLPFQWSCHTLESAPDIETEDQDCAHREFLHTFPTDPRASFVDSLLNLLESGGSIVHYHGFEKNVIRELAEAGIPGAEHLVEKFDRFIDLRKILEDGYADTRFLGKTSIKNVLPVVAPSMSYSDLKIQNGDQAQLEYGRILTGEANGGAMDELCRDLLAYCKLDTWAMVKILKVLLASSYIHPSRECTNGNS